MAMAGSIEANFAPQQAASLRAFLGEVMSSAGTEAAANLQSSQVGMQTIVQQMSDQQNEMKIVMDRFEQEKTKIETIMEQFAVNSGGMDEKVKGIQVQMGVLNLEEVDRKIGGLVNNLQEARTGAMETLRESYGSAKTEMDAGFARVDGVLKNAHDVVARIETRVAQIEHEVKNGGFGKGKGGGGGEYYSQGLVDMRDVKLPLFPEGTPSTVVFRKWWKDLSRYCSMREKEWKAADVIFRVIRGYPNQIDEKEVAQFSRACADRDSAEGGNHFQFGGFSDLHDRSRDMYTCLEHALNGKCSEMVAVVNSKDGFELLRKLARKYDPISPQAASAYKAQIFAFAGHPCASFAKTVERMNKLEQVRCEMKETTGENVEDKTLADVFFPTMDASCQAEILAFKVTIGTVDEPRPVNIAVFDDLVEYVKSRIFRERTLVPMSANSNRMDVSNLDRQSGGDNGGSQAQQWHGQDVGENWESHEDAGGQWFGGQAAQGDWDAHGGDLDAFQKGKGKGKGRVLECHKCGGKGHPSYICPSPENADPNGPRCSNCKGKGHGPKDCPSKGGGKFVPPEQRQKGKKGDNAGKGGKGQGGAGASKYFHGKGSGVSSVEEWGQTQQQPQWSAADWDAWNKQQWTQPQQQQQQGGQQQASAGQAQPWMTGAVVGAAQGGAAGEKRPMWSMSSGVRSMCNTTVGDGTGKLRSQSVLDKAPIIVAEASFEQNTTLKNSMLAAFDKALQKFSSPDYVKAVLGSQDDDLKKLDNGVGTAVVSDGPVGVGYTEDVIYAEAVVDKDFAVGKG